MLRALRLNPRRNPNVTDVRSSPPGAFRLTDQNEGRYPDPSYQWAPDTLPEGAVAYNGSYGDKYVVLSGHAHLTRTPRFLVGNTHHDSYHFSLGSGDQREWLQATKLFDLASFLEELRTYTGVSVTPKKFAARVLEVLPPRVSADATVNSIGDVSFTLKVPRPAGLTPAQKEKGMGNENLPANAVDALNALFTAVYETLREVASEAIDHMHGAAPPSRYSVVLTYKGVVLEVVPVETQQQAIDAMMEMQGDLRIKTVTGGSSKGAKANPYGKRRFR